MAQKEEWISFGPEGAFRGYLALREQAEPQPCLLLIQEAWGVDGHIQDLSRRFASAGYVVLAPDLYSQRGQRPEELSEARVAEAKGFLNSLAPGAWSRPEERDAALAKLPQDTGARISQSMQRIFSGIGADRPRHLEILHAAAAWLRDSCPASRGRKMGAIGFCMGGGLAGALAALEKGLSASVIFYGQAPGPGLIPQIGCPVMALHGEADTRLVQGLPDFERAMKEAGKDLRVKVYAGAGHAFLNDTRTSYHAGASRDAFARSLAFFSETLA